MLLLHGGTTSFLFGMDSGESTEVAGSVVLAFYSPDGGHVAISEFVAATSDTSSRMLTKIVEVESADERSAVTWEEQAALAGGGYVTWLNDRELFIGANVIGEPLILHVDGEVVRVASDLFARSCEGTICLTWSAQVAGSDRYHLLMEDPSTDYYPRSWLMYHSQDGRVDTLPPSGGYTFSPDGESLSSVLPGETLLGSGLWWRPTEAGESAPTLFRFTPTEQVESWSPDSLKIAIKFEHGFGVVRLRPEPEALIWSSGDYSPIGFQWSPDSSRLAVVGAKPQQFDVPSSDQHALFVVDVPSAR